MERQTRCILSHHDRHIGGGIVLLGRHAFRQRSRIALLTGRAAQDLLLVTRCSDQWLTRQANKNNRRRGVEESAATPRIRTTRAGVQLGMQATPRGGSGVGRARQPTVAPPFGILLRSGSWGQRSVGGFGANRGGGRS